MKSFAVVATALAAGSAVFAAPVADKREMNFGGIAGPLGSLLGGNGVSAPVGGSVQNGVADLFKLGDEILNIPGDTIRKLIEGNPAGAATGLLQDLLKAGTDIPKDAMGLVTPITSAVGQGAQGKQ
ncbi:hypothetical protein V2A60_008481 [Cordyceps javanica]|uniref:Uncharacterized protein n=1 Tax=Cordyceps javanica TaxID=43265 RepID=A0A545UPZ8_9HYPO|nr:hypothetical protein IF1G_09603 [Cordyceps javanica]TQW03680.1 hypothetical protein IF2G_08978 [Cordyceps javanica]